MRKASLTSAVCVLVTVLAAPLAGQMYLSDDEQDAIYTVDLTTGQATLVGPAGLDMSFSGLAYDSLNGVLYVSDVALLGEAAGPPTDGRNARLTSPEGGTGWNLATVDLASGALTIVGDHLTSSNIHGLAFDSANDVLYGADIDNSGQLSVIDRATGASTPVGPWGTTTEIRGLAYDAASDTLYGVDYAPGSLYTIDRTTGAATLVGALGFANGYYDGLEIDPASGVLYFVDDISLQLHSLDLATGQATPVGPLNGPSLPSGLAALGTAGPRTPLAIPALAWPGLALLALFLAYAASRHLRRSTG